MLILYYDSLIYRDDQVILSSSEETSQYALFELNRVENK